jgi:hypothetical protein
MPNGFYGPEKEWEELEAPLIEIDKELKDFAKSHSADISKNYHEWSERSLEWSNKLFGRIQKKKIRKLIQIYPENKEKKTYNLWICASEDRDQKRYWKNEFLKKDVPFSEIRDELSKLLDTGYKKLESWKENELEFATNLKSLKQ